MRDSCPLFQKEDASSLLIRYQLPFPEVLPLMQAGSLRVTHPFATHIRRYPFDLHVLGMPPAFILSQDQTLHLILTLFFLFSVICLDCFSGVSRNRRDFCFSRTCTIVFSFLSSFQRSSLP